MFNLSMVRSSKFYIKIVLHKFSIFIMLCFERKGFSMKKILLVLALLTPFVCDAAPKKEKKEEIKEYR